MYHDKDLKQPEKSPENALSVVARDAARLGRDIVETGGLFETIDDDIHAQHRALEKTVKAAETLLRANATVEMTASDVKDRAQTNMARLDAAIQDIQEAAPAMRALASWVEDLTNKVNEIEATLSDIRASNSLIASISAQVNILAINAKIEAARAGDAGRSFAVVADAVNELSKKTAGAATATDEQVTALSDWLDALQADTQTYAPIADQVKDGSLKTESALDQISDGIRKTGEDAASISERTRDAQTAGEALSPALKAIGESFERSQRHIGSARGIVDGMTDGGEKILQGIVMAGGAFEDAPFITRVQSDAQTLARALETAIDQGEISQNALFSNELRPIPGTDPVQLLAPFSKLTDRLFQDVIEDALTLDPRVVFCAAVTKTGYLPTHNRKFSMPHGDDPVWNASHCRNRRIFDDRVGLKAGSSTAPFLLQVYRRDMGGGEFRIMKDLSAPILVKGRHWGGLRLAYTF